MDDSTIMIEGYNPLCGDHFYIYLKIENDTVIDISFKGEGCAISKASASLMTSSMKGKTLEEAKNLFSNFHKLIKNEPKEKDLGKLEAFAGIWKFPARVKCAILSWQAAFSALNGKKDTIKTE